MNNLCLKRESSTVELWCFTSILDSNKILVFSHECGNEMLAEYVRKDFVERLEKVLREIRKEAYKTGYKDGRARRKKIKWFRSWLELP